MKTDNWLRGIIEDEPLPKWLWHMVKERRAKLEEALLAGKAVKFVGPNGEVVRIDCPTCPTA